MVPREIQWMRRAHYSYEEVGSFGGLDCSRPGLQTGPPRLRLDPIVIVERALCCVLGAVWQGRADSFAGKGGFK